MGSFLYAGSFDPFTRGHFYIVQQAVEMYGKGVVAISTNPDKHPLFDGAMRAQMVRACLEYHDRITGKNLSSKVEVVVSDGLSVDVAIKHGAKVLIRGVRHEEDYLIERDLIYFNRKIAQIRGYRLNQEHIRAHDDLCKISSTAVKQLCAYGEYVVAQQFVLPPVHLLMMRHYLFETFVNYCLTEEQRSDSSRCWEIFVSQMSRPYHNLSHIAMMLNYLNIYQGEVQNKDALIRAIFYHDYVKDDVCASFDAAKKVSAVGDDDWKLFEATDHVHVKRPLQGDALLMKELDLTVLGSRKNYDDYRNNLRIEYGKVSLKEYVNARLNFLTGMSGVKFDVLGSYLQEKAQSNIRSEIKFWEGVRRYGMPVSCAGLEKCE